MEPNKEIFESVRKVVNEIFGSHEEVALLKERVRLAELVNDAWREETTQYKIHLVQLAKKDGYSYNLSGVQKANAARQKATSDYRAKVQEMELMGY